MNQTHACACANCVREYLHTHIKSLKLSYPWEFKSAGIVGTHHGSSRQIRVQKPVSLSIKIKEVQKVEEKQFFISEEKSKQIA